MRFERIVNIAQGTLGAGAGRVQIGRIRYAASLRGERPESVPVLMTARDVVAQRTALFGMTRTGKSNTVKTIARAVFELRMDADSPERVAQLIIDPNGEYANENPQDEGCLRNIGHLPGAALEDVATYGLTPHPHDPDRRITKMNFFGPELPSAPPQNSAASQALIEELQSLLMGKQILDGRLGEEAAAYIGAFRSTDMTPPDDITGYSSYGRYRRAVFVYQTALADAGFTHPRPDVSVGGLFGAEVA